jgi:hypothetical protein
MKKNKMKEVLVAFEKHGCRVFDISTPELKDKSYIALFKERDKEGYYSDLAEMDSSYYRDARKGDAKCTQRIIRNRSDYEYERTEEVEVE